MTAAVTDLRERTRLHCDAVVVGGGAAGVAAAVTAARQSLSVILVERYGFCGGGAVAGLSGTVCGMYLARQDGKAKPEQAVFGFADEFVRALEKIGGISEPVRYGKTFTRVHDPQRWRDAADAFLQDAGVKVLFHSAVTDALLDGDRVAGVRVYNKSGKIDVEARVTIDASGDADVIAMAGLPSFVGDNGRVQNPTMLFRMGGIDTGRFLRTYGLDTVMPPEVSELILQNRDRYNLPRAKIWLFTTTRPNELLCNCTRIIGPDGRELNTLIAADFTRCRDRGPQTGAQLRKLLPRPSCRLRKWVCHRHWRSSGGSPKQAGQRDRASQERGYPRRIQVCGRDRAVALAHRAARRREAEARMAFR